MTVALTAYACIGLLLALWMSTRRSTDDWGTGMWTRVICLWPFYLTLSAPAVLRHWAARLRDAEVRALVRTVRWATRRLARLGYSVVVSRESEDGKE